VGPKNTLKEGLLDSLCLGGGSGGFKEMHSNYGRSTEKTPQKGPHSSGNENEGKGQKGGNWAGQKKIVKNSSEDGRVERPKNETSMPKWQIPEGEKRGAGETGSFKYR